ncbi:MAG: FGGY family carbohydrate kinase, partial [Bacilli bacterium]
MKKYVLALDLGTTSIRGILFDQEGKICGVEQKEFTQHFPQVGWVEHDANEIWLVTLSVVADIIIKYELTGDQFDS